VLFDSVVEYPMALILAIAVRPSEQKGSARLNGAALAGLFAVTALLLWVAQPSDFSPEGVARRGVVAVPLVIAYLFSRRPSRQAAGLVGVFLAAALPLSAERTIFQDRSFFGVHRVVVDDDRAFHMLVHGNTIHGKQSVDPERAAVPLTYYHPTGPLGAVLNDPSTAGGGRDVAVVGLGTGAMACFARPEDRWTFFEVDPMVEMIARDPDLFTFLETCAPDARVVIGDGRLLIAEEAPTSFDIVAVDAFSSDAVPVHLITLEAVRLYESKLRPDGVMLFHVSNRYLDLKSVLGNIAAAEGLTAYVGEDFGLTEEQEAEGKTSSTWVALARDPAALASLAADPIWYELGPDPGFPTWTDGYSNVLSVFDLE
jgi:SAM-dependent methyltransferase